MKYSFRDHHTLKILESYGSEKLPLDLQIRNAFRSNKALGSKDRAEIAETVYGIVRWLGLLDFLSKEKPSWESRLHAYKNFDYSSYLENDTIPSNVRVSFPKPLYELMIQSHGKERGHKLCLESNFPAPTTVRANTIKTSREDLLDKWKQKYDISPCQHAPHGIVFHKKINFFEIPEFKEGLFEIQDEGSQLLADLVSVKPGEHVLDFCSGSGGKTLAFAPNMQGKGQIYLHDIRSFILEEAKKRLRRAGIQNAQIIRYNDPKLSKLKKKMDWVLIDAPCSGTGTLRRNPDMKWKFSEELLQRLISEQRVIFEKALSYLKPGGRIVYGTCSLLNQENQEQIEHFLKTYTIELQGPIFQSLPKRGEMDGFFGATFKKG